jgi:hypothetical protein
VVKIGKVGTKNHLTKGVILRIIILEKVLKGGVYGLGKV